MHAVAVLHSGTTYYYVTNIQGDVIAILNNAGTAVVQYAYDAWGAPISTTGSMATTLGATNPLRYRSYIYDTEYGLYHLQSRYYDPEIGRFLNADRFISTGQGYFCFNMFAYCENRVTVYDDPAGNAVETVFDLITLGLSIAEVAANPADPMAWAGLAGDAIDLIPFVTGVGETIKGLRLVDKAKNMVDIADTLGDSIDTYRDVRKVTKGTGLEAHHIVEKRFVKALDIQTNKSATTMLSVPLTKAQHQAYTNAWRKAPLSYGSTASLEAVVKRGVEIYGNNPRLMRAFILTLSRH